MKRFMTVLAVVAGACGGGDEGPGTLEEARALTTCSGPGGDQRQCDEACSDASHVGIGPKRNDVVGLLCGNGELLGRPFADLGFQRPETFRDRGCSQANTTYWRGLAGCCEPVNDDGDVANDGVYDASRFTFQTCYVPPEPNP